MTEQELRQKIVSIMTGWEGATRGSDKHLEILAIYNAYRPLARGYAVQVSDAWCATEVSSAWIVAEVAEWTGTECSCSRLIELAKARGIWQERDDYVPKLGDAVLYDWDDGADYAATDNEGAPEHIGIVIMTGMGAFVVLEGNKGKESVCGRRTLGVNGRYIRGFIRPDYARYAAELTARKSQPAAENSTDKEDVMATDRYNRISDMPEWARNDIKSMVDHGVLRGSGGSKDADGRPADLDLSADMIRMLVLCKRMIEAYG